MKKHTQEGDSQRSPASVSHFFAFFLTDDGKKLFSSLFALLLSGVVLIGAIVSYAWFSDNKRTVAGGPLFRVEDGGVIVTQFQAYKILENGTRAAVSGEELRLPVYDSVFVERNADKTLVFRAAVSGSLIKAGGPFTITLNLQDMFADTGNHDNNYLNGVKAGAGADDIADYLSNVVSVKCAVVTAGNLQSNALTDATEIYNTAHEYFRTVPTSQTFVVSDGEGTHKDASLTFTVEDYKDPAAETGPDILYVYLEMGYDPALVHAMVESRKLQVFTGSDEPESGGEIGVSEKIIQVYSDLGEFVWRIKES